MPARKKSALKRSGPASKEAASLNFTALVDGIRQIHEQSAAVVNRVVNTTLTLRNWVIGWYLREYEQVGSDRANYGESLMDKVAERLAAKGVHEFTPRYLRLCRLFASVYPQIWRSLTAKSGEASLPLRLTEQLLGSEGARNFRSATGISEQQPPDSIWRSLTAKSPQTPAKGGMKPSLPTFQRPEPANRERLSPELSAPVEMLLSQLSFTHLEQLIAIEDPLKRAFYEIECIRGNWSVRELKRQIVTLYFERSGLSKDKEKLAAMVRKGVEPAEPKLAIRDPYIFEFLGLRAKDAVAESDLEAALLEHLREFLLELGHGFCLEAQQKSIVLGGKGGFVDLVFYHRLLKCHVLVELKVDEFRHEHIGQLNTYVTWYRKHVMPQGDNPPVGILLCTEKDQTLVEYATASMDNRLFVSKYAVELPTKAELVEFVQRQYREITGAPAPRRRAK